MLFLELPNAGLTFKTSSDNKSLGKLERPTGYWVHRLAHYSVTMKNVSSQGTVKKDCVPFFFVFFPQHLTLTLNK